MKNRKQFLLLISIFSGVLILTQILVSTLAPNVGFINGNLTIASRIFGYFAFSAFVFSFLLLVRLNSMVTYVIGVILLFFSLFNSFFELYPIDTTTEPIDLAVLRVDSDGKKLISRQYKNAKTNRLLQDTVLVKDYFIFRTFIEKETTP